MPEFNSVSAASNTVALMTIMEGPTFAALEDASGWLQATTFYWSFVALITIVATPEPEFRGTRRRQPFPS